MTTKREREIIREDFNMISTPDGRLRAFGEMARPCQGDCMALSQLFSPPSSLRSSSGATSSADLSYTARALDTRAGASDLKRQGPKGSALAPGHLRKRVSMLDTRSFR